MSDYVVIVRPSTRGYVATIERGTLESHSIGGTGVSFKRPTARWAKAAAERWIRRSRRAATRRARRSRRARAVTEEG